MDALAGMIGWGVFFCFPEKNGSKQVIQNFFRTIYSEDL